MKKYKIIRCKDCPSCRIDAFSKTKDRCELIVPFKKVDINKLPKWCPLEEYNK